MKPFCCALLLCFFFISKDQISTCSILYFSLGSHSNGAPTRSQARQSLNRPRSSMGLAGHTSSSGNASRNHMSALDNVNLMSHRHAPVLNAGASRSSKPGRPSSAHHQSMAKWSSLATAGEMANTNLTPTS